MERTSTPERAFAPLVLLDAHEPWRPMSGRWFIEHAILWFADDQGCPQRKIAVGRTLPEQRSPNPRSDVDWIYPFELGEGELAYFRNAYDADCKLDFDVRYLTNQLTRPRDASPARREELRPGEGFYLDLVDDARGGPETLGHTPVYAERKDEGDGQVRVIYWMLFGMSTAARGKSDSGHEGDWERIDVLLAHDGEDGYAPRAIQLGADTAEPRDIAWDEVARNGKHPLVRIARGSHSPAPARSGTSCPDCIRWPTWEALAAARDQHWYGFGGAWGELGPTAATTGPLGPHGAWLENPSDPSYRLR
jgi:hypothetical protein